MKRSPARPPLRHLRASTLLTLSMLLPVAASAVTPAPPTRALVLPPEAVLRIDGRLDETWWESAPVLDAFYETDPGDRLPPPVRTEVRFAVDGRTLYVAIRAWDPEPGALRTALARRDGAGDDVDKLTLWLDTMGMRQFAQYFEVSAAGVLGDGVFVEGAGDNAMGLMDSSPDYRFDAATGRFDGGWTAELSIPFSSLRYEPGAGRPWKVLVGRNLPRDEARYLMSAPVAHDVTCLLCFASELHGADPAGMGLAFQGLAALSWRGELGHAPGDQPSGASLGLDLKLRLGPDLDLDATWKPDFSQVEIDAPQLGGNTRFALYFPEKRPFFLEGADILDTPLPVLRTRSLGAPDAGVRLTQRAGGHDVALLVARDAAGGDLLLPGATETALRPRDEASTVLLGRARLHRGSATLGAVLSGRRYAGELGENTVAGLDATWRAAPSDRLDLQLLTSRSSAQQGERGVPARGRAWQARWFHRDGWLDASATWRRIGAGFRADNGFIERADLERREWKLAPYLTGGPTLLETGVYAAGEDERALSSGTLLLAERSAGMYLRLPRLTMVWFDPWMDRRERVDPGRPLHTTNTWRVGIESMPSRWLSGLFVEVKRGPMLDLNSDRVARGRMLDAWAKLQPLDTLQLQLEHRRQHIASTDGGALAALDETGSRRLLLWHLDATRHLRWIDQRRRVLRPAAVPDEETARSLSMQWRQRSGWVLDLGLASRHTASAAGRERVREAFVKLGIEFEE